LGEPADTRVGPNVLRLVGKRMVKKRTDKREGSIPEKADDLEHRKEPGPYVGGTGRKNIPRRKTTQLKHRRKRVR